MATVTTPDLLEAAVEIRGLAEIPRSHRAHDTIVIKQSLLRVADHVQAGDPQGAAHELSLLAGGELDNVHPLSETAWRAIRRAGTLVRETSRIPL